MTGAPAGTAAAAAGSPETSRPLHVAYIMSRFPKLTETFILYEILAVERAGVRVELYPLLRERESIVHPEAEPLVERAHFLPFISWSILLSQLAFLRDSPRRYLGAMAAMLRGTWGSLNFFVGGIGIFLKVAHAARLMRADGIQHVHCHFATHPALAGFLIHRLVGIPYSFTGHGSDLHVDRRMLCQKIAEAAFVRTISNDNRALIERDCGAGRTIEHLAVLHCGVDTSTFRPDPERDGGDRPFTVLCVGTLHEVKGQRHLLDAVAILRSAGLAVECELVGDGPDRPALEAQAASAGLGPAVRFLGQRTRAEVIDLLRRADVLVAPSVPTRSGKREGIPVVLIEAMAAGVPVVASAISGIPELVEDGRTGLTTPPGDASAIAAALRRLCDDAGLRRRLATAGRETVLRDFDLDRNAAALIDRFAAAARA